MSEPKRISPLLDGFLVGDAISDHHGVSCYPAMRDNTDERYIVKTISIPASQVQLDALLLTGAYSDREQAKAYFADLAQGISDEIQLLNKLSISEGFLPYLHQQTVEMEEGVGYEVCLISPYKRSLERQFVLEPLTHLAAVNLGLDLCAALAACRRAGFIFLDLKPSNIFFTESHGCCIGDLGFMPLSSLKYASLPEKYRSSYTAPEITDAFSELNDTMDIYALGLVLYQVYNNGQLPFDGNAPAESLVPPMYADYEMAEIILKACAPKPQDRWQDPAQMGQALVSYMQRNDVNAVPIVPPPVEIPEEIPEEPEDFLSEAENEAAMAELLEELDEELPPVAEIPPEEDLSFIEETAGDETVPSEEIAAELEGAAVTEEVAEMLAQVDELVAHELPEPPVAPEPIEIPFPAPIIQSAEESTEIPEEEEVSVEASAEESAEEPNEEQAEQAASAQEDESIEEDIVPVTSDQRYKKEPRKPIKVGVIIWLAVALVLSAIVGFGAYYYYNYIYLQSVETLYVTGTVDEMTVHVKTNIDETLLTAVCTDTYGNTRKTAVSGGKAEFVGLNPSSQYKITLEISGFHKLIGQTTGNFVTGQETKVLTFNAQIGPEDGSVLLSFTSTGPASDYWSVEYTDGTTTGSKEFSGSSVTVTGLTVGSTYHFTLTPNQPLYLTGNYELDYTAQKIIVAQNLAIDACGEGRLHAVWTLPEDVTSASWIVRCFNDNGYDETITTDALEATFENLDHSTGYTITVTAVGMNQMSSTSVTQNPVTITQINTDGQTTGITVTWDYSGTAPQQGWVLSYTINGSTPQIVTCTENSTTLVYYHGCHYEIEVRPQDDVTYYTTSTTFDAPAAEAFDGYRIQASEIEFSMVLRPDKENWDMYDLKNSSYRTTFQPGEKASFLMELHDGREYSKDQIVIDIVILSSEGIPMSKASQTTVWKDMWNRAYGELDIPEMPTVAGTYFMEIYFNDMLAGTQEFTIESATPPEAVA